MVKHSERTSAADYLPERLSLKALREAVQNCRGCDLYQRATQAVFGEGRRDASVLFVGEQPGDMEDTAGKPFVGPAGRILDRALEEAGIDRREVFITNVVKHVKWTATRGKRRLPARPSARQRKACQPWLEAEVRLVQPDALIALGASAAQALFGPDFRVTKQRGELFPTHWAPHSMGTVHPSSILRVQDEEQRHTAYRDFVHDLSAAARAIT